MLSAVGGRLSPLEDAAGALLRPRGLGAQDGPDRLIEDGFEASLGEGRALQVFHGVWVRQQEARGLGQDWVLGETPSQATQPHQAVGAAWAVSVRAREFFSLCLSFLMSETGILNSVGGVKDHKSWSVSFLDTQALNLQKAGRTFHISLGRKGLKLVTDSPHTSVSSRRQ